MNTRNIIDLLSRLLYLHDRIANLNSPWDTLHSTASYPHFLKENQGSPCPACSPPPAIPQAAPLTGDNQGAEQCIQSRAPRSWRSCPRAVHLAPTGPQGALRTRKQSTSYMFSASWSQDWCGDLPNVRVLSICEIVKSSSFLGNCCRKWNTFYIMLCCLPDIFESCLN